MSVEELNRVDLIERFEKLFRRAPNRNWTTKRIFEEVDQLEKALEKEKNLKEEAERNAKALEIERAERAKTRGTFKEFASSFRKLEDNCPESALAFAAWKYANAESELKEYVEKFSKDIEKNPLFTLAGADVLFSKTAKAEVARIVRYHVENGLTGLELYETLEESILNGVRFGSNSNSTSRNFIHLEVNARKADLFAELKSFLKRKNQI